MPKVTGEITTTAPEDTYPTHDSFLGKGGHREVVSMDARNAIPTDRRRQGMTVYTMDTDIIWKLKAGPWTGTNDDWDFAILPPPVEIEFPDPALDWIIPHPFGEYPGVKLFASDGQEVIGDFTYEPGVVTAHFDIELSGKAVVSPS